MLRERSQTQKAIYPVIPLASWKRQHYRNRNQISGCLALGVGGGNGIQRVMRELLRIKEISTVYLDGSGVYRIDSYVCQNSSNHTPKKGEFY